MARRFRFLSCVGFDVFSGAPAPLLVRSDLTASEVIIQVQRADVLSWDLMCIIQIFL